MGLLDDAASVISARTSHSKRSKSHRSSHHKDRSKSRSRSRSRHRSSRSAAGVGGGITGIAASIFGGGDDDHHHKHDRDRDHHHRSSSKRRGSHRDKDEDGTRSFFGLPNPGKGSSFFSGFGGRHSPAGSSYYKRSPRPGFVSRVLKKLKRLLRDLLYYAKRHPLKVFMLVLMPLITGGALTALLARFGLRLPKALERMLGLAAKAGSGDGLGLVGEAVRMVGGATAGGAAAGVAARAMKGGFDRVGGGDGGRRGRGGGEWYV